MIHQTEIGNDTPDRDWEGYTRQRLGTIHKTEIGNVTPDRDWG